MFAFALALALAACCCRRVDVTPDDVFICESEYNALLKQFSDIASLPQLLPGMLSASLPVPETYTLPKDQLALPTKSVTCKSMQATSTKALNRLRHSIIKSATTANMYQSKELDIARTKAREANKTMQGLALSAAICAARLVAIDAGGDGSEADRLVRPLRPTSTFLSTFFFSEVVSVPRTQMGSSLQQS